MSETTYLQNELRKAQKAFRTARIAMAVVLVVFVAYFQWMKSALADVLTPDSIAEFAVNQANSALPVLTETLTLNLKDEAPGLVRYVLHEGVDQILPHALETFQTSLNEYGGEVNTLAAANSLAALRAVLRAHKADSVGVKHDDPAMLATRLGLYVETHMSSQLDAVTKEASKARLESTSQTIKKLDAELVSMATQPSGDHSGALGKNLITTWWSFVDRSRAPLPSGMVQVPPDQNAEVPTAKPGKTTRL